MKLADLDPDTRKLITQYEGVPVLEMSTVNDIGVTEVKNEACERLLQFRVDAKLKSKKIDNILNRVRVAMPASRDEKIRPPCIPG